MLVNFVAWGEDRLKDFESIDDDGEQTDWVLNKLAPNNNNEYVPAAQHRTLNQIQKIYDKFNSEPLNPYSSLKVRFKMKTKFALPAIAGQDVEDIKMPEVQVGIMAKDWNETPNVTLEGATKGAIDYEPFGTSTHDVTFDPRGGFNSSDYFNFNGVENQTQYTNGSSIIAKNSYSPVNPADMNQWEQFEFSFNLSDEHLNKGTIYGVPYGGRFDREYNGGDVKIILNSQTDDGENDPSAQPGNLIFKMETPSYASDDWTSGNMRLRSPSGAIVTCTWLNNNGDTPKVVFSLCGDDGTTTDVNTSTTNSLEAYLMYVDAGTISGASGYGGFVNDDGEHENTRVEDGKQSENLCVVYWDGTEWSFDSGHGYEAFFSDNENESVPSDTGRYYNKRNVFVPTPNCFILARFYAESPTSGITSMEQYIDNTPVIYSTTGVDNLFFFIQAYTNPEVGDDFLGCVFFDDFEVYESEEFYPDVDVRKKLSTGNYGTADLTEYYDRELQPEQYKDSQAPLEAQFYFYPTYPTNQIFDTKRTPMYEDFKRGFFYIYDVDWGDGTPKEFTSEPEQIDEEKVILHTYETHGIFEVTGYMLRVKVNENGELLGVVHNKRFSLRINVNEGLDEDFQYFGSDGFSFIPYKNTLPVVGGYSKESIYYKSIKRQLGFIEDDKIFISYKNKGDKLKTELALDKMDSNNSDNYELLNSYKQKKYSGYMLLPNTSDGAGGYPGENIIEWPLANLEINGQNIPLGITQIIRFNPFNTIEFDDSTGTWDTSVFSELITGTRYVFVIKVGDPPVQWNLLNSLIENEDELLINNGIKTYSNELGKSIGDVDTTNVKFYTEPKSIWQLFGFEDSDLNEIATPTHPRYWKNIIPQDYSIFLREGLKSTFPTLLPGNHPDNNNIVWDRNSLEINIENMPVETDILEDSDLTYITNGINIIEHLNENNEIIMVSTLNIGNNMNNYWTHIVIDDGVEQGANETSFLERENKYNFRILSSDKSFTWKELVSEIDVYSEQNWLGKNKYNNTYYYPVLPRYSVDGKFSNNYPIADYVLEQDEQLVNFRNRQPNDWMDHPGDIAISLTTVGPDEKGYVYYYYKSTIDITMFNLMNNGYQQYEVFKGDYPQLGDSSFETNPLNPSNDDFGFKPANAFPNARLVAGASADNEEFGKLQLYADKYFLDKREQDILTGAGVTDEYPKKWMLGSWDNSNSGTNDGAVFPATADYKFIGKIRYGTYQEMGDFESGILSTFVPLVPSGQLGETEINMEETINQHGSNYYESPTLDENGISTERFAHINQTVRGAQPHYFFPGASISDSYPNLYQSTTPNHPTAGNPIPIYDPLFLRELPFPRWFHQLQAPSTDFGILFANHSTYDDNTITVNTSDDINFINNFEIFDEQFVIRRDTMERWNNFNYQVPDEDIDTDAALYNGREVFGRPDIQELLSRMMDGENASNIVDNSIYYYPEYVRRWGTAIGYQNGGFDEFAPDASFFKFNLVEVLDIVPTGNVNEYSEPIWPFYSNSTGAGLDPINQTYSQHWITRPWTISVGRHYNLEFSTIPFRNPSLGNFHNSELLRAMNLSNTPMFPTYAPHHYWNRELQQTVFEPIINFQDEFSISIHDEIIEQEEGDIIDDGGMDDIPDTDNLHLQSILFPRKPAPITDEKEREESLIINITPEKIDRGVLNDLSGKQNHGFIISDYKPNFNSETLSPQKTKKTGKLKKSNKDGAF